MEKKYLLSTHLRLAEQSRRLCCSFCQLSGGNQGETLESTAIAAELQNIRQDNVKKKPQIPFSVLTAKIQFSLPSNIFNMFSLKNS